MEREKDNLYITQQLKIAKENITNYIENITNNYTKETYFNLKEDLFYMRHEIRKIEEIIKNREKFFEMTFEDKFGHSRHFVGIDEEISFYKALISSKKTTSGEIVNYEERIKILEERKEKYE